MTAAVACTYSLCQLKLLQTFVSVLWVNCMQISAMAWYTLFVLAGLSIQVTGLSQFPALDHIVPSASAEDQAKAVEELIERKIGSRSTQFKVTIDGTIGPKYKDTFQIVSDGATVSITATSGVAGALGFYHYLKTFCDCQVTWAGSQLRLPASFPVIKQPGLKITTNDRFRYYQNVCTVSYSFVWWDWPHWEEHIDWMAMNGINLPLAFTGQEAIFQRVYIQLGFSIEDLQEHFGGPAFLAWARMGNMEGWGGPLPQSWIANQLSLQHKILARMRQLGMIPVLPGFAGHVPRAITRLYPNVTVNRLGDWGHFNSTYCCTYLLDFKEPLFQQIGTLFIQEMQKEFGIDHIYNADSFNEMTPKSSDPAYLKAAGQSVYQAMVTADPQAIWLMQGWLFQNGFWKPPQIEALLTSVPQGKMIVLDLFAEVNPEYTRTQSFYGQPFIWCMLHNFGGTMELYGAIDSINKGPFVGRSFPNSTMIGLGLTPEGIFQNEAMYEFMNENAIVTAPRDLKQWFIEFVTRRYSTHSEDAINAWQLLKSSVFNDTDNLRDHSKNVIPVSRPSMNLKPDVWYNPQDLFNSWNLMNEAAKVLANSSLFRYDLVDIARNSIQNIALKSYMELVTAYNNKDIKMFSTVGKELLLILGDLDTLLGTDPHFLLGRWIQAARSNGNTPEEKDLMEFNARNQITLWGPTGEIRDYANKQWSGLISHFYIPRWQLFITYTLSLMQKDKKFNSTEFNERVYKEVEVPFNMDRSPLPSNPTGDSVKLSAILYQSLVPQMKSPFFFQLSQWVHQATFNVTTEAQTWIYKHWWAEKKESLIN